MRPEPDPMRIAIECRAIPGFDEEPAPEVIGRNGTLNRELNDFKFLGTHATPTPPPPTAGRDLADTLQQIA